MPDLSIFKLTISCDRQGTCVIRDKRGGAVQTYYVGTKSRSPDLSFLRKRNVDSCGIAAASGRVLCQSIVR